MSAWLVTELDMYFYVILPYYGPATLIYLGSLSVMLFASETV
jgi:hypothetical protein